MAKPIVLRQGDLTLIRVGPVPDTYPAPKAEVLAEGETSGHWHELVCSVVPATWSLDLLATDLVGERRGIVVPEPAELVVRGMPGRHETVAIPPGTYEVIGAQREYVPGAVPRRMDD